MVNWWNYDMVILLVISKALPVPTSRVVKNFFFYHPTAVPGHCSVWPDLTWDSCFLLSVTVEPTVCMGLKKCFSIIYQACSRAPADQKIFLKFHPTLGRNSWFLAEGQNHCRRRCGPAASFKHFFFGCRPKMIIDTHSIRFLGGCSAPIGCNLNCGTFHENPALGLI